MKLEIKKLIWNLAIYCSLICSANILLGMDDDEFEEVIKALPSDEADMQWQGRQAEKGRDYGSKYPLHAAVKRGNFENIKQQVNDFLGNDQNIDEEDAEGKTPLFLASYYRNTKAIQLLMVLGCDPNKVLNHPKNLFLSKDSHKKVNDLLTGNDVIVTDGNKLNSIQLHINRKINKRNILNLLDKINNDSEGIYIFTGLINNLILNNDAEGLKKLLRFKLDRQRLKYVDLSLRDENILLCAINSALPNDNQIVELLLSEMDPRYISEQFLIRAYLSAKTKKDIGLLNAILGFINTYFPGSSIVARFNAYKCGERINAKEFYEKKKKAENRMLTVISTLGVFAIGFIGYQWLKTDKLVYSKKLIDLGSNIGI